MNKLLLLFMLSFCLGLISAVPPFQTGTFEEGITIQYPPNSYIKTGEDITFNFHIYNTSNGVQLDNNTVNCSFHLYNKSGVQILENDYLSFSDDDFYLTVKGGNFTKDGAYSYIVTCISGTSGGYSSVGIEATGNGKAPAGDFVILGFSILMVFIFFSLITYVIKSIGNIIELNFDLLDVAFWWGLYFALLGVNRLANIYLGTTEILNWLNLFVTILGFPMVLVPMFAFFISMFSNHKKKKIEASKW